VSLPGCARASATSSCTFLAGTSLWTTRTLGVKTTSEIGARSLTGSYGSFSYRLGWMVMAGLALTSVEPSGLGFGARVDRTMAAGAGRILDQDGFAPGLSKLVCKQPRCDVRGAARRKTDENSNGFVRVGGLGKPVVRSEQRRQRSKESAYELHFRFFSLRRLGG